MSKFFEKNELFICILLIVIYLISNSLCMQEFEIGSIPTVVVNILLTLVICIFIKFMKLNEYLCLNKVKDSKKYLYFFPLILIISANLWNGINLSLSIKEIILYILAMIFIGFLEEIIFRGFLLQMMLKDNEKVAIIVTSLTFGIGHIINLLNGAEGLSTVL